MVVKGETSEVLDNAAVYEYIYWTANFQKLI